jgi:GT2 family glycosyltransferase
MMDQSYPLVYIILLNWNGWKDTIECLESIFRNQYPNYRVIVCDNDSQDGSLDKIKLWAEGRLECNSENDQLNHLTSPPVFKPLSYVEYNRQEAENGGRRENTDAQLILIQTGGNLGFAGGNNVGLRFVMARNDFSYVWLLNNDTVIEPDALNHMVKRMQDVPGAGICGSTLLYYHDITRVQALGGATYNRWAGVSKHIGQGHTFMSEKIDIERVEKSMAYVVGASMLVSRDFLQEIGLLCEDYFLYYEELDWAIRSRERYRKVYAKDSIVYHKEGASIGSNSCVSKKSLKADYYGIKNRLVFTKRFFPYALPTVYLGLLITLVNRIRRKQWNRIPMILRICFKR